MSLHFPPNPLSLRHVVTDIAQKDKKQSKTDKTEYGNRKSMRNRSRRKFWCTAVTSDLNSPADNSEACPLKEFIIKFTYVGLPSPELVKAELAKIATSAALVQRTPVLKTSFLMA
ncbi:hypothetical protein Tco_1032665 [Tanacetum coccineum]|uniref:Uncharacterized protein n=1 Tax=Tanacetum coccineum TaxID=301880 RepID=A0ABQ5GDA5_9ASTR